MKSKRQKKEFLKRFTATVLAFCMAGTCADWAPIAQAAGTGQSGILETQKEEEAVSYVYEEPKDVTKEELTSERTESSTTWQLSDGNKQVVYYSSNVRYEDEDGNLTDYDPSLVAVKEAKSEDGTSLKGYAYENAQGDMKHYIPEEISEETPLRLENGAYSLEVSPLFTASAGEEKEAATADEKKNGETAVLSEAEVQKEEVTDLYGKTREKKVSAVYSSEDDSLKLEYIPFESGVKENLILEEKPKSHTWQFAFHLGGGLTARKDGGMEGISFYAKDRKEEDLLVGGIQVPYMNDATGENYSEAITYDLEEDPDKEDSYILTMTADPDWLD